MRVRRTVGACASEIGASPKKANPDLGLINSPRGFDDGQDVFDDSLTLALIDWLLLPKAMPISSVQIIPNL